VSPFDRLAAVMLAGSTAPARIAGDAASGYRCVACAGDPHRSARVFASVGAVMDHLRGVHGVRC
jgi:hypothetical protein